MSEEVDYCAIVEGDQAVSRAAVWKYSDDRWEVAALWTRGDRRGRGMAKSTVSFVTEYILSNGRLATLHTQPSNVGMIRAAIRVGFKLGEPDQG